MPTRFLYTGSMSDLPIRTRFAPSPTGYLHVGNVRTALYAYLLARKTGGRFFLRIEDTDRSRFVADGEAQIKDSLAWLGLEWEAEVWRQSERLGTYQSYAQRLIGEGSAYVADETPEELSALREQQRAAGTQPHYDGRSRDKGLTWQPDARGAAGSGGSGHTGQVVRFRWPEDQPPMEVGYFETGTTGESGDKDRTMTFSPAEAPSAFEDFVLIKADGYPTYNFAHVIDDHEMEISDVIRGDEFVASLNKYQKLYDVLGWQRPRYVHVPPILGPDGQKKLSKREGSKSTQNYRVAGYLPGALANFIALIGWNPGADRELFFSLDELADAFTLEGLQKAPGRFDEGKLRWMNKEHMKNLGGGQLLDLAIGEGFWKRRAQPNELRIFELAAERANTLAELSGEEAAYYFERPRLSVAELTGDENRETVAVWLERVQRYLEDVSEWTSERLEGALTDIRGELDLSPKQLYPVLRVAVTGAPNTPALWDVFEVLGQSETLARLEAAAALVS